MRKFSFPSATHLIYYATMACRAALRRLPLHPLLRSSPTCPPALGFSYPARHSLRDFRLLAYSAHSKNKVDLMIESMNNARSSETWKIKMLYDGDCPLCMREVNMLRERNRHYGAIKFVDISSTDYSPEENGGLDYETVMGRIHAILSDGTVLRDVEGNQFEDVKRALQPVALHSWGRLFTFSSDELFRYNAQCASSLRHSAFRRLYEVIGLGWVYAITKYAPINTIANAIYSIWAKYRLQITGRPPLQDILKSRKEKLACGDDNCKI